MKNKYTYKLTIGDWSGDGHEKSDEFVFTTNKKIDEIQRAYLDAVTNIRVAFHRYDDRIKFNEKGTFKRPKDTITILADYEDSLLPEQAARRLEEAGIDLSSLEGYQAQGGVYCDPRDAAYIFLEMVRTQFDGFEYEFVENEIESINGWWGNLNIGIGYGCYS